MRIERAGLRMHAGRDLELKQCGSRGCIEAPRTGLDGSRRALATL